MDPSQHGAPSGWHQAMSLDDVHGTASMRKKLMASFDNPSQQATAASAFIPTLPSPEPENLHQPQHRHNAPVSHWADGQRPPTPPLHHLDDAHHYPRQWDTSVPLRGPSGYTPLPPVQADYTSPYGTFAPASGHLPVQRYPPQQADITPPRLHPSVHILRSSPQNQALLTKPAHEAPSIQHWPTHNLVIDAQSKKKQEIYRRKGEAARRKTISSQDSALQYEPIPEPASTPRKRKAGILNDLVSPTPFRRLPEPYRQQQQYYAPPSSFYYPQHQGVYRAQPWTYVPRIPPHTSAALSPPRPKIIDPETIPQHITNIYDEYKWPVKLYQLQAEKGYDFAESFLQALFVRDIYNSDRDKWHAHTTTGFIKNGNGLSILVLHNAANPFEWGIPPESTTSIGVYGLNAHEHNEIHWTTIAPRKPEWFKWCEDHGFLEMKQKWHPGMKASDKRFHRAYWLAANMLPLNRILNSSLSCEKPYGALEDSEDDRFSIAEEDLQHGWVGETVSVEESEKIWQKLVDDLEGLNLESLGFEHFPIGGSEREFMVD